MSKPNRIVRRAGAAIVLSAASLWTANAQAQALALAPEQNAGAIFHVALPQPDASTKADAATDVAARFHRQVVNYPTVEAAGTIVVDTPNTYLYFVLGGGKAMRYGIGVGREGFTWSGVETIERKSEWPDWLPPSDMLARQPYLPRFMAGGPGNPLGARAMYLGGTVYRIHGTNEPSTIGHQVSSGCIRLVNEDVTDLYERAHVGTKVVVLPMHQQNIATSHPAEAHSRLHVSSLR